MPFRSPLFLLALASSLCAPAFAQQKTVVAKVGDTEVYAEEVRAWLSGLDPAQAEAAEKQPSLLTEAVRTLLVQRLVLKEAESKKWAERPEVAAKHFLENLRRARAGLELLNAVDRNRGY